MTSREIGNIGEEYTACYLVEKGCVFDVAVVELRGREVVGFRYIQRAFTA